MKETRYTVGEMANLCNVTAKQLRHYDEQGLLKPAHRDDRNGYRYYDQSQIEEVLLLTSLKALDLPNQRIAALMKQRDLATLSRELEGHLYAVRRERDQVVAKYDALIDNILRALGGLSLLGSRPVGEATARAIGRAAAEAGIALSLHAPYFVNPANPDPDSQEKTLGHVLKACQVAQWMGADRVVVHTGALQKRTREEALATAKAFFQTLRRRCDEAGYGDILLCPETMGKITQLGDLEEVLAICAPSEGLLPCVDFGHLYARSLGALDGAAAVERMLDRMVQVLGEGRARVFHSHFSKIEYTPRGGEARHLTFDQPYFGPDYHPLCQALARRGWAPRVICESAGTQDVDALAMQRAYRQALGEGP